MNSSGGRFRTGDIVYIHKAACRRLPWHEFGPDKSDDSLFIGPFKIIGKVGGDFYKLDLPRNCRVKNCFEERMLKRSESHYHIKMNVAAVNHPHSRPPVCYKQAPVGQAFQMDRANEIIRLVEARKALIRPRYRAQWKGCDPNDTTFITENVLLQLPRERRDWLLRDLEGR